MIKNSGLGLLAEVAAGEDYYPVRRRGEKRRLNPNRAAIEWLESDTFDLTEERSQYLMTDTGGRHLDPDDIPGFVGEECVLVTKTRGSTLGTHLSRPMFECFGITRNRGMMSYSNPCPDCYNFAYSSRRCGQHNGGPIYVPEPTAPTVRVDVGEFLAAQERIDQLGEHYRAASERQAALYAMFTGVDGAQVAITWRVNPS